jgi:TatA/E family protein of Tat protein translocase
MEVQPTHLVIILVIAFVAYGPGKLPDLGKSLGESLRRELLNHRGQWGDLRGALFMAKGIEPSVGRDVGDMLPDEEARRSRPWFVGLLAILVGTTLYFLAQPLLPAVAQMRQGSSSMIPGLVDLCFCTSVFGLLGLPGLLRKRDKPKR